MPFFFEECHDFITHVALNNDVVIFNTSPHATGKVILSHMELLLKFFQIEILVVVSLLGIASLLIKKP